MQPVQYMPVLGIQEYFLHNNLDRNRADKASFELMIIHILKRDKPTHE